MGFLLQFLYESNLIEAERPDITLGGANLGDANLLQANLEGANLVRANLTEADLERATLLKANLTEAELQARAQVVTASLIPELFCRSILPNSFASTYGPFLSERPMFQ